MKEGEGLKAGVETLSVCGLFELYRTGELNHEWQCPQHFHFDLVGLPRMFSSSLPPGT